MIRVLDKHTADKIAAGEVVDRPASIVKELVENSIDAGASSVTIEIKKGGKELIRVTDNGSGIAPDEAATAFLRHATSKISNDSDLDAISTLGFRGEALSSIAAVSRVEMLTKTAEERSGRRLVIEGGELLSNEAYGCPEGTSVVVRDLFFNVPARLKFLRADAAEAGSIIDLVGKLALGNPDVKFRLINNGNTLFITRGNGELLETIGTVFDRSICRALVPVEAEDKGLKLRLSGYISRVDESRTNKRNQFYYVNGRLVESKVLEEGVSEGYKDKLFSGRFPMVYLFLETRPEEIDVNIHPNKREIRFHRAFETEDFIRRSIREALMDRESIPKMRLGAEGVGVGSESCKKTISGGNAALLGENANETYGDSAKTKPDDRIEAWQKEEDAKLRGIKEGNEQTGVVNYGELLGTLIEEDEGITAGEKTGIPVYDSNEGFLSEGLEADRREYGPCENANTEADRSARSGTQVDIKNILSNLRSGEENAKSDTESEQKPTFGERLDFTSLNLIGSIFATYIAAYDSDNLYLIDQHAAHERIFYETLMRQYDEEEKPQQLLLAPILCDTDFALKEKASTLLDVLSGFGYDIEEFGPKTLKISAVPAFMDFSEAEDFLHDFLENYGERTDLHDPKTLDRLATRACKAAVKGNDKLDLSEIKGLLSQLSACENPYSCPHGRPTFIRMSKYEIERSFKRV